MYHGEKDRNFHRVFQKREFIPIERHLVLLNTLQNEWRKIYNHSVTCSHIHCLFINSISVDSNICLLFTILRPFGTRESIKRKVDHGGQIVLWYWQHATNLAKVTVFIVCMSSSRVFVWVKGKVEQKHSLTFCVFGHTRSRCSSSSTFPKSQPRQSLSMYGTPFHAPSTASSCVLPHRNRTKAFYSWTQLMSHKYLLLSYDIPLKRKYIVCTLVPILWLVKSFQWKPTAYPSLLLHSTLCGEDLEGVGPQPPGWSGLSS
jgi:hypothetical protein